MRRLKNSEKAKDLETKLESNVEVNSSEVKVVNTENKKEPEPIDKSEKEFVNELETKYKENDESEKTTTEVTSNDKSELKPEDKMTDYGAPDYKNPKSVTNPNYESETTK